MSVTMTGTAASAMDGMYRHQRYIYDVTRRYYLLGRDKLIEDLDPPVAGTVLEIGCGTARNLLRAAHLYPAAQFYGIDVSAEMLKTARAAIGRSPARDDIVIAQADATAFSAAELFGVSKFDRIFISYALSMIPPWEAVIDRALLQLGPRGELHIVDFGSMEQMPWPARSAMRAWLARFSVTPRLELENVISEMADRHGRTHAFSQSRFDYSALARIGPKLA